MSPQRARQVGLVRKRGGPVPPRPAPPKRPGLDLYHMLSAVVGAYVGLVFYSLVTPGMVGRPPALPTPDPRQSLSIERLSARPMAGGMLALSGTIHNAADRPCRLAVVTVKFLDGNGRELTQVPTTVEQIAAGGNRPFEVHALAHGARDGRAAIDLAQF